jgi:hypothetical protein
VIRDRKNAKKGFDRSVDRPVECHFAFCLQQKWQRGVVGRKSYQRVNKREIAKIVAGNAKIAKIEKPIASFVLTVLRG